MREPIQRATDSLTPLSAGALGKPTHARVLMLALIFGATTINYLDRANLAVAAPLLSKDLQLSPVQMGLLFSAFAWSYALANLPGGFIVDRFGVRLVYGLAQFMWSAATFTQGFVGSFAALFGLRLGVGVAESPAFPANNRVVTMWFPQRERGLATSVYVAGQYIGTALFTPLLFWLTSTQGWRAIFLLTGSAGIVWAGIWFVFYRDPRKCARANQLELQAIEAGGALTGCVAQARPSWPQIRQLFRYRQIWAICLGKFCISCTLYFFLTWFPTYLIKDRHMTMLNAGFFATLPYIAATVGVMFGGAWSDWLLRGGHSMSLARKLPIITGFACVTTIVLANFTASNAVAIGILSFAFFAQGVSSTSWAIISEVAPKELIGITGGVCNFAGNLAGVFTPIAIGFILRETGSFDWALGLVGVAAVVGALSYTLLLGPIHRIVIAQSAEMRL